MNPNAWYGCRRDTKDQRDTMMRPMAIKLPDVVDLRPKCPPVMDQGELGSCTAHGITGAMRYEMIKSGKPDIPLARLQLYYDERKREGTIRSDAGAEIRDGIKCAAKIGIAKEALWSYQISLFKVKPTPPVYADAKKIMATKYERVEVEENALRQALAQNHAPIIGLSVYDSFESAELSHTGMVPMPDKRETNVGGHCMYVVGYGQRPGTFTVRNSWADDWGDKGDCYFPVEYLSSKLLGSDYWIITELSASQ